MDRCALFVDAGYVLADGAMAVHGTRRRESVSWDYAGLLKQFGSIAADRTRLPVLRCYWYDSTAEGQRLADHDTLADLPGVKLRLAKKWPGRKEGVEGEIRRDLTTLARNKAVSDVMLVSAEEGLAQVIADVQDMGLRVTLLQVAAADGDASPARALRQECDDIVEVSAEQLQPYVELISGAEPSRADEPEAAAASRRRRRRQCLLRHRAHATALQATALQAAADAAARLQRGQLQRLQRPGFRRVRPARRRVPAPPSTSREYPGGQRASGPAPAAARPRPRSRTPPSRSRPRPPARLSSRPPGTTPGSVDYNASADYGAPAAEQPAADHGPAIDYAAPEYPAA